MKRWNKPVLVLLIAGLILWAGNFYTMSPLSSYQGRNKRIIYIYKTTQNDIEFWRSVTAGIETGAKEFGYEYTILGPQEEADVEGNVEALQRAISLKPDAIVLSAADYNLLEPVAQKAVDEGILLLTLDSDVAGDAARCYVGTDNYGVGQKMGWELMERMPAGGLVGIVGHVSASRTATERVRGAQSAVEGAGGKLLPPVYCNNVSKAAKEETLALLAANPDLKGLIATNERAAIGVCEALVEAQKQDQVTVITCDHSTGQITYLEQGVIDATIVQKPFNMGYFSVQFCDKLLREPQTKDVPEVYDTGWEVITLENYFTRANQQLLFPVV